MKKFYNLLTLIIILSIFLLVVACNNNHSKERLLAEPVNSKPEPASFIVLCYHSFLGRPQFDTDFYEREFIEHLEYFESHGYSFVSYEEISNGKIEGYRNILLTFDDGNLTNYTIYHSVLKPRGIKALFAIFPAIISTQHYAMTWDHLRELMNDGNEIAAHGYFHLMLEDKNYFEDAEAFRKEIIFSKQVLEQNLGKEIRVFVYPFGLYGDKAVHYIKQAGYETAFTVDPGRIDYHTGEKFPDSEIIASNDNFLLPRYIVLRSSWEFLTNILDNPLQLENKTFAEFRKEYLNLQY